MATTTPDLLVKLQRIVHFYTVRVVVIPSLRRFVIKVLRFWIGRHPAISAADGRDLETLRRDGIVSLNGVFTPAQCREIRAFLTEKPVHDRASTIKRVLGAHVPTDMAFGNYDATDVIKCPHVMEVVNAPRIVDLAAEYLGCAPTLSSLGIKWSFPNEGLDVAQRYHRDWEDWLYVRFIVYLTDVDEGAGPHVYVKGTHLDRIPLRLQFYRDDALLKRYGGDRIFTVLGGAGTGFAADTAGIHKGELPRSAPRLVLMFTFSLLPNPFSSYTPVHSAHPAWFHNYTNRKYLTRLDA